MMFYCLLNSPFLRRHLLAFFPIWSALLDIFTLFAFLRNFINFRGPKRSVCLEIICCPASIGHLAINQVKEGHVRQGTTCCSNIQTYCLSPAPYRIPMSLSILCHSILHATKMRASFWHTDIDTDTQTLIHTHIGICTHLHMSLSVCAFISP